MLADEACTPNAPRLADPAALLAEVPGWQVEGDVLTRTFRFPDFASAVRLLDRIAAMADAEDHHPDLTVSWGRLTVSWSTHSAGGLTRNDYICAAKVDRLA